MAEAFSVREMHSGMIDLSRELLKRGADFSESATSSMDSRNLAFLFTQNFMLDRMEVGMTPSLGFDMNTDVSQILRVALSVRGSFEGQRPSSSVL